MWEITGYVLLIVSFAFTLLGRIAKTPSARSRFSSLGAILWALGFNLLLFVGSSVFMSISLGLAPLILVEFIASLLRWKVAIPPCVWEKGFSANTEACITGLLFGVPLFVLFVFSPERWGAIVGLISCVVFFALFLGRRSEICGNGVWCDGALHKWQECEPASWTMKEHGLAIKLKFERKTWPLNLTVPTANSPAEKQLLQTNLINSAPAPEAVKA